MTFDAFLCVCARNKLFKKVHRKGGS